MSEPVHIFAGPVTMLLARLLGEKIVSYDSGVKMTAYRWRGVIYIYKCELATAPPQ